ELTKAIANAGALAEAKAAPASNETAEDLVAAGDPTTFVVAATTTRPATASSTASRHGCARTAMSRGCRGRRSWPRGRSGDDEGGRVAGGHQIFGGLVRGGRGLRLRKGAGVGDRLREF